MHASCLRSTVRSVRPPSITARVPISIPTISSSGETHRVNLTWQVDDDKMVYATYSTGFRPGGANRIAGFAPYTPDTLTNYEIGCKTSWDNDRFRFNGAFYWEDWKNIQFSFLGPNSSPSSRTPVAHREGHRVGSVLSADRKPDIDRHRALTTTPSLTAPFCDRRLDRLHQRRCQCANGYAAADHAEMETQRHGALRVDVGRLRYPSAGLDGLSERQLSGPASGGARAARRKSGPPRRSISRRASRATTGTSNSMCRTSPTSARSSAGLRHARRAPAATRLIVSTRSRAPSGSPSARSSDLKDLTCDRRPRGNTAGPFAL